MKLSLKWLSEYVEVPTDIKAFCDRLDLTGTGVEGIEKTGDAFKHIVTAQVLTKKPHPNSDHLFVTSVDVGAQNIDEQGSPEPLQIVCGAQNFKAGDHIVCALIGSVLPGNFKIKKSKLRGIESFGMNCSARELGLSDDHEGIMILPDDAPVGMSFADYAHISDTILDLEVTPNRPDCLSVVGMAREVGAMYRIPFVSPLADMVSKLGIPQDDVATDKDVVVSIEDAQRCPRYTARVIRGCKVGPSPSWMVERLTAIGQRSINNIVDISNYILFLFGQPLHTFDLDKLKNHEGHTHIVVRGAKPGETLITLDGETRVLTPDMTVIATPEQGAVALAGVMGGRNTEVDDKTVNILLETATFEAGRTSRTSRNLGLMSESSLRYERGVDDCGLAERSAAAAALIMQVAGGVLGSVGDSEEGIVDQWPCKSRVRDVRFRIARFCAMMGTSIPREDIVSILEHLGCQTLEAEDRQELKVRPPSFRPDLTREIDLYEEVLRLWGINRIPSTLPSGSGRLGTRSQLQNIFDIINDVMRASGLNESMTLSLVKPDDLQRLRMTTQTCGEPVVLINPLNVEQSFMRQSIVPGLLRNVAYNQSRGVKNIQLYEIGSVFFGRHSHKLPKEHRYLAGVLVGAMQEEGWNQKPSSFDFFDAKGVVESLARELALPKLRFQPLNSATAPHLQPGRAAAVFSGDSELGWVGELHPLGLDAFEVQGPVAAFELKVESLVKMSKPARDYVNVPTFPAVEMDVAFVVPEELSHEKLTRSMVAAGGNLLKEIHLFDVYRDEERVGVGKKSMAFSLSYRDDNRTLTTEEVEKAFKRLVKKVGKLTGAEVRA